AALAGSDVPARALPHPRLHLRRPLELPLGRVAGRPDVHADHLAAGDLAAPARGRLRLDPALGRDPDAAADRRLPARRAGLGDPLRPLRLAAVRDRRHARLGAELLPARDAAGRLLVRRVRSDPPADGALD